MSVTAINVPGGWGERQVTVVGRTLNLLLPADPDEFINQLDESETAPWPDPYWAKLWPAAETTAALVCAAGWPGGTRVLEIGCGVGLPGLAALTAGCAVTFSDYVPLAVELALENAARNGLADHARGLVLDWRQPLAEQFPLIIASDVLYYSDLHAALLGFLENVLAPRGVCWIGDPGRSAAEEFVKAARQSGWTLTFANDRGVSIAAPKPNHYVLVGLHRNLA